MAAKGLFHAFGLFWRRDEIDWTPGRGNRSFALLGRRGEHRHKLRVANFRFQNGIYILYGNHGPHYVGLTRKQGIGKRLKDHLADEHRDCWDRFSWFSFGRVLSARDLDGLQKFAKVPVAQATSPGGIIGDIEAILIRAMALRNTAQMNFSHAHQWEQIKLDEVDHYYQRAAR